MFKLHSVGLLGVVDGGVLLFHAVDALRDLAHDFVDGGQALRVHLLLLSKGVNLGVQLLLLSDEGLRLLDLVDLLNQRVFSLSGHRGCFQPSVQDLLAFF